MTLPILTWNLVGPIPIRNGNIRPGPGALIDKATIMYSIGLLMSSSTYWQVDATDITGSQVQAYCLKPVAALTATPNTRIIVSMDVTGSNTWWQDTIAGTQEVAVHNSLVMGFSPDVTTSYVPGTFMSDRPFGQAVRWSKYWSFCPLNTVSTVDRMYLLESSETLMVGICGRNTANYAGYAGALAVAPDTQSGETDGRVYGMSCVNQGGNASMFLSPTTSLFGHGSTQSNDHFGVFIVSGGVANAASSGSANSNTWSLTERAHTFTFTSMQDSRQLSPTIDSEDTCVFHPLTLINTAGTRRIVGIARQVYGMGDMASFITLTTGTNPQVPIGITWSGADAMGGQGGVYDCALFGNG